MQTKNIIRFAGMLAALGIAIQLSGCGGGSGTAIAEGTLRVSLANTGSTACYDTARISVDSLMVNQNANAAPGDSGWQPRDVPLDLRQARKVDLQAQTNNSAQEVVSMTVPAGHYAQVRVWLEQNSVLVVAPNWVMRGPDKITLDTSKAASIPIPYAFTVPANGQVNLTLSLDVCQSIVETGGMLQLIPTPVITATSIGGT